jgi:hypothetical protein
MPPKKVASRNFASSGRKLGDGAEVKPKSRVRKSLPAAVSPVFESYPSGSLFLTHVLTIRTTISSLRDPVMMKTAKKRAEMSKKTKS